MDKLYGLIFDVDGRIVDTADLVCESLENIKLDMIQELIDSN
ncbi:MAG: hypothetical protein ACYSR9_03395 [Planctomycetota bacterium]|jgi:beta-phosphoglucomutase-like phosphatase (HAD superfamily)